MVTRTSFSDVVESEAERLLKYVFNDRQKQKIKDFGDFREVFLKAFNSPRGKNAMVNDDDLIKLFQTKECKSLMKDQVSKQEYDHLYGDGIVVKREAIPEKRFGYTETITPKVTTHSYTRNGKTIKGYSRTRSKWTDSQKEFIQTRKQKGLTPNQIIKQFEERYNDSEKSKTHSAIRNKIYKM